MEDIDEFISAFRAASPQLATAIDQAKATMLTKRAERLALLVAQSQATLTRLRGG